MKKRNHPESHTQKHSQYFGIHCHPFHILDLFNAFDLVVYTLIYIINKEAFTSKREYFESLANIFQCEICKSLGLC